MRYVVIVLLSALCAIGLSCASDEAYLVLDVRFPQQPAGMYGFIEVQRNSGPALDDGPIDLQGAPLRRRIAIHAEDYEIDSQLEVQVRVCSVDGGDEPPECVYRTTLEITQPFTEGTTRVLCVDLATVAQGRLPPFDAQDDELPTGVRRDCQPDD